MQERKRLEEAVESATRVKSSTDDLDTLFELMNEGENVSGDIEPEMRRFRGELDKLETAMLLSGENDARSAIVTIHPGAGGTESQDWAEMLMRMYLRWAERSGYSAVITDRLEGEGAGIKSATFEVNGRTLMVCCSPKSECTGWCAFRHSIRRRGGIRRSPRCLFIRRSTTRSRST